MLKHAQFEDLVIRGGRVIDPFTGRDEIADVVVRDGTIASVAAAIDNRQSTIDNSLDASGLIVCPGLIDMHVHLREPGQSHKETIETGTAAAAAGGFTFVVCMPNTSPPIDNPDVVRWIMDRARLVGQCDVAPVAAITRGRAGKELTDFAALLEAGAIAFSDDGAGVDDDAVMLAAFEQAAKHDTLIIQHCEYRSISAGGVMHKGEVSTRLGLPGLDPRSEEAMIERDIDQCRRTGARYHVAHISTAKAVDLVRRAKRDGLPVTAEVCTHHLLLTAEVCATADPNTKMHPPLRPQADVEACRQGLLDDTIDCIVTDHAPHTPEEKAAGFLKAPAGIVGLETAIGVAAEAMIATGLADWPRLIGWFTTGPSRVLYSNRRTEGSPSRRSAKSGRETDDVRAGPGIEAGRAANLTLIDPNRRWTVRAAEFHSKCRNTPFEGRRLTGRAVATIRGNLMRSS